MSDQYAVLGKAPELEDLKKFGNQKTSLESESTRNHQNQWKSTKTNAF